MKVLGIGFGKRVGNTEVMVKNVLKGAEELGAEVEYINGLLLNMKSCIDCSACINAVEAGKSNYCKCILKDDVPEVQERMMDADALVIGAAVWGLGSPSAARILQEKTHIDLAHSTRMQKIREEKGMEPIDPRVFKPRPVGIISQGGSRTKNWTAFNAAQLTMYGMSMNNTIVDMIDTYDMTRRMDAVSDDELLERCRQMGRNLVEAVKSGKDIPDYVGDVEGVCPVCHLNLLSIDGTDTVTCPQCGIEGKITVEDGKLSVKFQDDMYEHSRMRIGGLFDHQYELIDNIKQRITKMNELGITMDTLKEKKDEYRGYADVKIGKKD